MAVELGKPDENFEKAEAMLCRVAESERPDIAVFPETLNTGFYPRPVVAGMADVEGEKTKALFSSLARRYGINIVAGSVTTVKSGSVYNTSYTFDREGKTIAEYDKIHAFSPAGEEKIYAQGTRVVSFELDGIKCGVVICYDIRFGELIRMLALRGIELLFVPAEWPDIRRDHWITLNRARAIENQMFVCAVNGCGSGGKTIYGGHSLLVDPWGKAILHAGESESIEVGEIDLSVIKDIRESINVFRDRRPDIYEAE